MVISSDGFVFSDCDYLTLQTLSGLALKVKITFGVTVPPPPSQSKPGR